MKKVVLFVFLSGALIMGTSAYIVKHAGGIVNTTGSSGESTCAGCHGGGAGATSVLITASPAFVSNKYIPSQTYTITVTVSNASYTKFGFDSEILTTTNTNAGTMTTAMSGVQMVATTRTNATHTTPKAGVGSAGFSYVWVAPASGVTRVYACGMAVNGDGGTAGDAPGSALLSLSPNTTGVSEAALSSFSGLTVYPNPIISDYKVQYNLIDDGDVRASLFDIHGKEIAEIINEKQNAGNHILNSTLPSDLSKGVYFVKLSLNGKTSAQRLIITQ